MRVRCDRRESEWGWFGNGDDLGGLPTVSVVTFFKQWLHNPLRTGAIVPSSKALAMRMIQDLDFSGHKVVIELGSGTGAFSAELERRMQGRGVLILVEQGEELAEHLRERFPGAIVICDCVSNLSAHLEAHGYSHADYIVSGLPWTLFTPELQDKALRQVQRCLKPGGIFVTFIYLHGMRLFNLGVKFEQRLRTVLGRFEKSRPVWANIPPARVWTWRRPPLLIEGHSGYLH